MEEMVVLFAEKGIIAGAFIYMLHLFLSKFVKSQELIVQTLTEISMNMSEMNERLTRLEKERQNE